MRVVVVPLLLLSACVAEAPKQCAESFCLPLQAKLLGKREVEDFNLYQVEWNGERFGIYEGDFPDFDVAGSKPIAIPLDANAKLRISGNEGQVLAHVGSGSPGFIHLTGPCTSRSACSAFLFATGMSAPK